MSLQPPLWGDDGPLGDPMATGDLTGPQATAGELGTGQGDQPDDAGTYRPGCWRCEGTMCALRAHDRRQDFWARCWHEYDLADAHALGDHRWCAPGEAEPLGDGDPHGDDHDTDTDGPTACRWAARWRVAALALAAHLPSDRLGVVVLDPITGPQLLSSHGSYATAGPARTRVGRRPGDMARGVAKGRAVVVCRGWHLH